MAVNLDNERKYLEGLMKTGTAGQKEWATKQAKSYGFSDFGQPKPITKPKQPIGNTLDSTPNPKANYTDDGVTYNRNKPTPTKTVNLDNERKYLEGIMKTGTQGQKEWATKQAKSYGFSDFGKQPIFNANTTNSVGKVSDGRLSQDDYVSQLRKLQESAKSAEDFMRIEQEFGAKQGGWYDGLGQWVDANNYKDDQWRNQYFNDNEAKRYQNILEAAERGELVYLNGKVYNADGKKDFPGAEYFKDLPSTTNPALINEWRNTKRSFNPNGWQPNLGNRPTDKMPNWYTGEKPTYTPPTQQTQAQNPYDDYVKQVQEQLNPLYDQALKNINRQKYQDELNASELANSTVDGGGRSGLGKDLQNKVALNAANNISSLDAQRQSQTAEMARALMSEEQMRQDQLARDSFNQWLAEQNLSLNRDQFDWGKYMDEAGLNFNYDQFDWSRLMDQQGLSQWQQQFDWNRYLGQQGLEMDKDQFDWTKYLNQQGLDQWQKQFDYGKSRDVIGDKQWEQQFNWGKYVDQQNLNNRSSGGSGGTSAPKPPTATQMKGSYIAEALKSDNPIKWVQEHMADLSINGINPSDVFNEVQAALKFMPKLPKDQNGNYFLNTFANPNL